MFKLGLLLVASKLFLVMYCFSYLDFSKFSVGFKCSMLVFDG